MPVADLGCRAGGRGRRSSAKGAKIEAPKAPRGVGVVWVSPSPLKEGSVERVVPLLRIFLTFELKTAHFSAFWELFLQTAVI